MSLFAAGLGRSLRTKILLIVVGGTLVPLALVGVWLAEGVKRSGEGILRSRLDSTLTRAARDIGESWVHQRAALLSIADDTVVRNLLVATDGNPVVPLPRITRDFPDVREITELVLVNDGNRPRWVLAADSGGRPVLVPAADSLRVASGRTDIITISFPVRSRTADSSIGSVEARVRAGALTSAISPGAVLAGSAIAIVDRQSGAAVVQLPFELSRMREGRFVWAGEEWLAAGRMVEDPAIELLVAAPITAYTAPFESASRRGTVALLLVAIAGLAITLLLTRRVTRSLVQLAAAADSVTQGDLTPRVELGAQDEVGRVARAFNEMVESVRRMLRERSEREAVAAVGEFATSLAHEIRNPLSAVRLNLQHVQERLPDDETSQAAVSRALADIDRLNRTVGGVLRMARSGRLPLERMDIREPIRAAMRDAQPLFDRSGAVLQPAAMKEPLEVLGNSAALEQLFLNLLLNAAQATPSGARSGVEAFESAGSVAVTVWDEGGGFEEQAIQRAFDPFFSTKAEGTGLGLTLARRIAAAHSGSVEIDSAPGRGSRVRVSLPRASGNGTGAGSGIDAKSVS